MAAITPERGAKPLPGNAKMLRRARFTVHSLEIRAPFSVRASEKFYIASG